MAGFVVITTLYYVASSPLLFIYMSAFNCKAVGRIELQSEGVASP